MTYLNSKDWESLSILSDMYQNAGRSRYNPVNVAGNRYQGDRNPAVRGQKYNYIKRKNNRKGTARRKSYRAPSMKYREGGQTLVHGQWNVPELMSVDMSWVNVNLTTFDAGGGGDLDAQKKCVTLIAPGAGFYQRRGRKIALRSLRFDVGFTPIASTGGAALFLPPIRARLVVLYDRQANGTTPQYTQIFADVSATSATPTPYIWANPNLNGRERFKILADEKFYLPGISIPASTADNPVQRVWDPTKSFNHFERYIKFKDVQTVYGADTTPTPVIGDIQSGAVWLMFFRDTGAYAVEPWTCNGTMRLRYADP